MQSNNACISWLPNIAILHEIKASSIKGIYMAVSVGIALDQLNSRLHMHMICESVSVLAFSVFTNAGSVYKIYFP